METFNTEIPLFEGESLDELKALWVKFRAAYDSSFTNEAILEYIFSKLREPGRWAQACQLWPRDLELNEQIRSIRENGVPAPELTKDQLQAKILATIVDENLTPTEKKARLDGYSLVAKINGWEVKAIDKTIDDKRKTPLPLPVFRRYVPPAEATQ